MRLALAAALCVIALGACQRQTQKDGAPVAAAPTVGFQHEAGFDAQGYYKTLQPIGDGSLKLTGLAIGAPSDFETWESGKREEVFGPIELQFEDLSSPMEDAENGRRRKVRVELKPSAYRVSPGQFAFQGNDPKLGQVDFQGVFDTAALAQAKAGQSEPRPALNGTLTIGGKAFVGVGLAYQSGD